VESKPGREIISFVVRLIQLQFPNACVNISCEDFPHEDISIEVVNEVYKDLRYHTFCLELQRYILWPNNLSNVYFVGKSQ